MIEFNLSDADWDAAMRELRNIGYLPSQSDRQSLELMCGVYVYDRVNNGKRHPRPAYHKKAWQGIASASRDLLDRISEIEAQPDAADLDLVTNVDLLKDILVHLEHNTKWLSDAEGMGRTVPNKSDPTKDWLARGILSFWTSRGGKLMTSTDANTNTPDGPLVRFLDATYGSAVAATGETKPTRNALRHVVRDAS